MDLGYTGGGQASFLSVRPVTLVPDEGGDDPLGLCDNADLSASYLRDFDGSYWVIIRDLGSDAAVEVAPLPIDDYGLQFYTPDSWEDGEPWNGPACAVY